VVGRASDVPWAMAFPGAGPEPRHPSQLYEAALEGVVLFLILRFATHRMGSLHYPGMTFGLFLIFYGLFRSFVELFREPDQGHPLIIGMLTPGMIYSLPMIAIGLWLVWRARARGPVAVVAV
jgi:phosphatidylglycerol:prolipoprotein diacylglycerol transferase